MKGKTKAISKVIAVIMFAVGALVLANARIKRPAKPQSFVIHYRMTRTELGKAPVFTGLLTSTVKSDGTGKHERFSQDGADVRYIDNTAAYKVVGDHLEYIEAADSALALDEAAQTESWFSDSGLLVREETVLGLKAFTLHQDLSDGWWEGTFSTATRHTPLIDREQHDGVITSREAVSIQFRDVGQEVALPDLAIRFDQAQKLVNALRSGSDPEATKNAVAIAERMRSVQEKLARRPLNQTQ